MRRLVVLSRRSRLSGVAIPIAIALSFVISACSSTTTALSGSNSCDGSTTGDNNPDNSATAFLAGGGPTIEAMTVKIDQKRNAGATFDERAANGMKYQGDTAMLPIPGPVKLDKNTGHFVADNSIVKGVMCPNGDIYASGSGKKLMSGAWLVNRDPSGTADSITPGLYGHPASQVLKAPCQALVQSIPQQPGQPVPASVLIHAVCTNGSAVFDFDKLYP
jgi:hypothetical protein